jgi:hypothetical protein
MSAIAFAIVQWAIVLPIQLYCLYRSWRNWKASDKELLEAFAYNAKAHRLYLQALDDVHELGPGAEADKPPTVQ